MEYSAYHQSPPSSGAGARHHHNYSSPNTLQTRANLRSCLRQGNFSSNRSTRSTSSMSYPQQQQSRGDEDDRTARSAPTTTGSLVSTDNEERQFMKLSNLLATQHKSGKYSYAQGTRQLLHYYIPSARQRQLFFQSLRRNKAFLPMFPEPNENPGYALTRYVDRVFGPLLEREYGDVSAATTSGPPSPMRVMQSTYPTQQSIQHFSSPINISNNHPMMFPFPNNLQQSIQHLRSPVNIPPPPLEYTNNQGPMLFPPPSAARDEVATSIDRVPPPIQPSSPMVLPVINDPVHIQSQHQQQQHHVSFPMYSPPDTNNTRETSRQQHHLPRPHHTSTTTAEQSSFTSSSPSKSRIFTLGEELNKTSHIQQHPSMNSKSLLHNTSTDTISLEGSSTTGHLEPSQNHPSTNASFGATEASTVTNSTGINKDYRRSKVTTSTGYQKFSNRDMLPPITPRENILYNLPSREVEPSSCCSNNAPPRAKRKRPTYLQLYVKCDRSEPYLQPSESMDIVTWYRNGNNEVTADRSLVVRGTTSLLDLIGGIIETFGLFSDHSDACMKANASSPLLMAYNDVCFMSDIKTTENEHGETTNLTPLPIPGFYYKYVDREVHGRSEMEKESLLSTDPVVLTRTLVAQVLDKPLYQSQHKKKNKKKKKRDIRTRLALVYCTPKREAYVSPRTQKGVLPETIYHFQILLDGVVHEDDLPSSFTSQTAIRCVGSTGGVAGGSMIDSTEEIQDLNRTLWGVRDVVGLVNTSTTDPQRNLEQIIDVLGVPLFDNVGNQTLKEPPLDRCLYHIYSGNLSLSMAKKTQRTVEKMQGTTEWLAKGVEAFTKGITASLCVVEDDNMILFGGDDDLDGSMMSRLSVSSSKSRTRVVGRRNNASNSKRLYNT